ncbi:MAG: hypothetical protein IPJ94_07855 [Chloroflexi bacterium]|nr:hypothetical protein [Chloroflexota bacterium]
MVSGVRSGCARGFADGNGRAAPTDYYCDPTAYGFAFADDGGDGDGRANSYRNSAKPLAHIDLTQLPAIPIDNSKTYNLKRPSYEFLRDWLQAARETPISILPKYYILDLLAFDFARSFPEGAGSLDPIFQEDIYHGAYLDDGVTWPLLETAVVAHLNQNQIRFEAENPINISSGITLEPKAVDLGGDGVREWMVKVKSDDLHILGVIPLTINQSDQFAILPEPLGNKYVALF